MTLNEGLAIMYHLSGGGDQGDEKGGKRDGIQMCGLARAS